MQIRGDDAEGRKQLARYMIRHPFSLEKMEYKEDKGVVVCRVDPLICPRCGGRMRLIALIEEPAVIEWPDTDHLWPLPDIV